MAVLPIIKLGHSSLRKRAAVVTGFDATLQELVDNMIDTMRVNDGIGLAAPQVNVLQRLFVIDLELFDEPLPARAYVNPEILESEGSDKTEEGCLSIPDVRAEVSRPEAITVRYQTINGKTVTEAIDGLLARVFQHESDHLNGVLFIDHLSLLQRKMLEPRLNRIREDHSLL